MSHVETWCIYIYFCAIFACGDRLPNGLKPPEEEKAATTEFTGARGEAAEWFKAPREQGQDASKKLILASIQGEAAEWFKAP